MLHWMLLTLSTMMPTLVMDHLQPTVWYIENPLGLLGSLPVMQPLASQLLVVSQCHFGLPYRKDTCIWTSEYQVLKQSGQTWRCVRGSECVYKALAGKHHISAQGGPSRSGRPWVGGGKFTQQIPGELTLALALHLPWGMPAGAWVKDADCRMALFAELQDADCRKLLHAIWLSEPSSLLSPIHACRCQPRGSRTVISSSCGISAWHTLMVLL